LKNDRNIKMSDIFDNKIVCRKCNVKMEPLNINKDGFLLRAVSCAKCGSKIIHPRDEQEHEDFINLKRKEFIVKMRFVGNSYAISIPKEIVNFMREQEKIMDYMVKLCFEEFGKISLSFGNGEHNHENINKLKENGKINHKVG